MMSFNDQANPPPSLPLIIDNFAGSGGASTGIEMALGHSPNFAINHDPEALAMHEANHPETIALPFMPLLGTRFCDEARNVILGNPQRFCAFAGGFDDALPAALSRYAVTASASTSLTCRF
jgi:site-specific DNA-cytosine methylase